MVNLRQALLELFVQMGGNVDGFLQIDGIL